MYPDLVDMSAPGHAFAIRNDMDVRQYIHNQFEKRAANVISQYRTNSGVFLDKKTHISHV